MKLPKSTILLINVVLILIGLIMLAVSFPLHNVNPSLQSTNQSMVSIAAILDAIATGLIATGGVNLLDKSLTEKPTATVEIVALKRTKVPPKIHDKKYHSAKVDLLGMSLSDCLDEIVNDRNQAMISHIFEHGVRLRMIFVNPNASVIAQRAVEDNLGDYNILCNHQKRSVELCVKFYKLLKKKYEEKERQVTKPVGSVLIKLTDFCPHFALERYDNEIYWGLYTADTIGMQAPLFLTTKINNDDSEDDLHDQLKKHFVSLLEKDMRYSSTDKMDNFLVRMVLGEPMLNFQLAEVLLGKDRLQQLMGD
jgi:hypothetical protein